MGYKYVPDQLKSYTTGVLVADRLAVQEVTGEPFAAVVDPARPGVVIDGDTDTFGQRLAAGGSVEFDDVPVGADDVLGSLSADEPWLGTSGRTSTPPGELSRRFVGSRRATSSGIRRSSPCARTTGPGVADGGSDQDDVRSPGSGISSSQYRHTCCAAWKPAGCKPSGTRSIPVGPVVSSFHDDR
ncbi:hypothetical protein [Streptomyces sp. NPDC048187]|uniref:hypothetical protein n=1 Tax=Streptomyces sp. NPDC048187 TaxID=3365509 RepID=UPI003712A907